MMLMNFFLTNSKKYQKKTTNTFIHNFLDVEQYVLHVVDKSLAITPNEGFQLLRLSQDTYSKEYNFPTLFFGYSRPPLKCFYQKITQEKLTNANRKFAYHITNVFFKITKILIHFILSFASICIQKTKLLGCVLIASHVLIDTNLDKILKFDLGYK